MAKQVNKTASRISLALISLALVGCGGGSKEVFGVYEAKHSGIDYETGNTLNEEFTYKYSFMPNNACVYYDGQKDMMYYTCTYKIESDNTYTTNVILRSSDNKTLIHKLTVKDGKSFEAVNQETGEAVTFTKSNEKLDTQTVIDVAEYTDTDKTILTAMTNFCKDPNNHEYYSENSSIPTLDSAIKGLEFLKNDGEYYYYTVKDKNDATEMLRAYGAIVMAKTDCKVEQAGNGIVTISGGSGKTLLMGAGNDSSLGFIFMVTFM